MKIKVVHRKLGKEKAYGLCSPGKKEGEWLLEIDERLRGKEHLKTLIHEVCHAVFPNASESAVTRVEKIFGDVLWRQGYRRVEE
jgi:hypothetical protein